MKREFLQGLQVGKESLPKEVIDAIMAENGKDIQAAKEAGSHWEEKYNRAVEDHARQLAALELDHSIHTAVTRAGGRNVKAITALLDLQAIAESDDIPAALEAALTEMRQTDGYLFALPQAPGFAPGTGTHTPDHQPQTLAGALRERMADGVR